MAFAGMTISFPAKELAQFVASRQGVPHVNGHGADLLTAYNHYMYRVLSVSSNVSLLMFRNDILAISGFSVISPRFLEQTPALAASEHVDAVVMGHSIEAEVRREIIAELRRVVPNCVICFVYSAPHTTGEPLADVSIDVTHGPEPLILALQERPLKTNTAAQSSTLQT